MRCIFGIVLILVLYSGSCTLLGEFARKTAIANDPRHSAFVRQAAKKDVLRKYHALIGVGAGAASILACAVPTLLARASRHEEWQS